MRSAKSSNLHSQPEVVRHRANNFHPTVWDDYVLTFMPMPSLELEIINRRIDELKEVIKKMLKDESDQLPSLEMIDAIHHLGVTYHFELEINDALKNINKGGIEDSNDLHTIALRFRLLRQQQFSISADVFSKFIDAEGDFKDCLKHDAKALLSLYDAAHLATPAEKILENAADFARTHLKLMLCNLEPILATLTYRALETPQFKRMERLEAREYLSLYDEEANKSEILLEFVKLDFHFVQSIHLEELRNITLWKNSMALVENLPFVRDRIVEQHFCMIGVYFEPCYSRARIMATKILTLTTILDDIYDQYGTLEELELLTNKIDRWELEGVDHLTNYLQFFCMALCKTFKDFEDELTFEKNSFRLRFIKEEHEKIDNHFSSIIQCYANEHKCLQKDAHKRLVVMVEDAWKTLNQEYLLANMPLFVVRPIIDMACVTELFFKDKDNFTNSFGSMKDNINLVMVKLILSKNELLI